MPVSSKKIQTEPKPRASRKVAKKEAQVVVEQSPVVPLEVAEEVAVVQEGESIEVLPESLAESVESCPPISKEEQIREQVNNQFKQQLPELFNQFGEDCVNCSLKFNIELKGPAFEEDVRIMSAPVFDLSSSDEESPVSPCESPKMKRVKKEVAPKALINEVGDYLNPKTNRYVKAGTAAFKKLVKEGLIILAESI